MQHGSHNDLGQLTIWGRRVQELGFRLIWPVCTTGKSCISGFMLAFPTRNVGRHLAIRCTLSAVPFLDPYQCFSLRWYESTEEVAMLLGLCVFSYERASLSTLRTGLPSQKPPNAFYGYLDAHASPSPFCLYSYRFHNHATTLLPGPSHRSAAASISSTAGRVSRQIRCRSRGCQRC